MICAILLDGDDSKDFSGNTGAALGRPLSAYPLLAAKASSHVQRIYAVSDSPPVKGAALQYGAELIDPPRPAPAAEGPWQRATALLNHGWAQIRREALEEKASVELLVVLSASAPNVNRDLIDAGIEALLARPELDSALSVTSGERWHPSTAKREDPSGLLEPFVPAAPKDAAWYPDWGVCVVRPRCVEKPDGPPPAPWFGRKVLPLKQWSIGPIDHAWQIPCLEYWLKKHGIPDLSPALEPMPKPQASPKSDRR